MEAILFLSTRIICLNEPSTFFSMDEPNGLNFKQNIPPPLILNLVAFWYFVFFLWIWSDDVKRISPEVFLTLSKYAKSLKSGQHIKSFCSL